MRPRKIIVLVDSDEQRLSRRAFMLETRGIYRVIRIEKPKEALEYLRNSTPGAVDLLIADLHTLDMDGNELVRQVKVMLPGLKTLIVSTASVDYGQGAAADAFLTKGNCTPAEILFRVKILVAKKRGPKRKPVTER